MWKVEDEGDLHDLLGIEFKFVGDTVTLLNEGRTVNIVLPLCPLL